MAWLKNAWYVAGFQNELDGGKVVARTFLGTAVVMMRHSDGRIAALEDLCPHRLMPLSAGKRVGDMGNSGFFENDLLGTQSEHRRVLRRQSIGFVVAVGM